MNTAIFSAIKSGDLQSLIVLFDEGLNILDEQLINEKGQTPVEFALDMAKPTIFHFLINKQTEAIEKMQNQTEEYRNAKAILDKIRAKNSMNKNGLIEMSNGDKHWYFNNQLHREDGPAIEEKSGNKYWFKNGKLHREDGPAVVRINAEEKWYIDGIEIKEKIASEAQKEMKEKAYNQKISPQEKLQQLIIESKHIKILEEIALKNKLQENKEVSRLYINLLDEKDRVEPDILAKKEIIAKKMGYGLMNNRDFYFSPQSKDYVYQLASFNIFKDYNKTLQQAQSGGIIFEWVLKKIFDLSNIMENGSHIDQSELFKIKPLPHFKSKAEMMIFATRYYFANFDNLKHLFLQVNKDNIKKTIIEDIKLIQSHGTREEIEQNIYTLFNYIYNSFIKDVKEQGYATSNRQEKNFYNEYTFNLFLDILKEDKTLLTQECYGDILSSLLNSENKSTVDKKDDIGFFMNLVQSSLNQQQMISIYAALVEHAKNIQAFNVVNTFTTSDVSDEMLSYLLRYHFPKNILKSADLIKHASFMNFLKSESVHTCWKEIVLNLVDLKDFNTTEQDKLIEALLLDSSLMTLFKEQKEKNYFR